MFFDLFTGFPNLFKEIYWISNEIRQYFTGNPGHNFLVFLDFLN